MPVLIVTIAFIAIIIALIIQRNSIKNDLEIESESLRNKKLKENVYKIIAFIAVYLIIVVLYLGLIAVLLAQKGFVII